MSLNSTKNRLNFRATVHDRINISFATRRVSEGLKSKSLANASGFRWFSQRVNGCNFCPSRQYLRCLICFAICIAFSTNVGSAATVAFLGQPFESALGPAFSTGVDHVYGTITFDAIGDSQARSFSLTATSAGNPAFTFSVSNATAPQSGVYIANNSFSAWQDGAPTNWNLTVFGNLVGPGQEEQISIHSILGDLSAINLLGQVDQSVGTSRVAGAMQAVPEPSSFLLVIISASSLAIRRKRS